MAVAPLNAYSEMAKNLLKAAQDSSTQTSVGPEKHGSFLDFLQTQQTQATHSLQQGEMESLKAIAGQGDFNNLVTALAESNLTLKAVLSIRDKLLQTMQELRNMQV
jgi:flagellar hook-basal body complex protein FliE